MCVYTLSSKHHTKSDPHFRVDISNTKEYFNHKGYILHVCVCSINDQSAEQISIKLSRKLKKKKNLKVVPLVGKSIQIFHIKCTKKKPWPSDSGTGHPKGNFVLEPVLAFPPFLPLPPLLFPPFHCFFSSSPPPSFPFFSPFFSSSPHFSFLLFINF